jgi:DGQHR domain-containing protein
MTDKQGQESISFPAVRAVQPIGEFYIGVIDSNELYNITYVDVRRIKGERQFETYLGIQRELVEKRVKEIAQYTNTVDACFPTAVILAVQGICAAYDAERREMTLSSYVSAEEEETPIPYGEIAKVLDGQHRIEGLKGYKGNRFDVTVCIFVDMDVAEQAYLFSTVNYTQTKVRRSLVYDLFDLAKAPSPQKLCHNIAVALDVDSSSPFHARIKRLGVATPGRDSELITQATFVQALMKYVSWTEMQDRDLYKRGDTPARATAQESQTLIFRNMMIDGQDTEIGSVVFNYFSAARDRWPQAWNAHGRGMMLNRTNGVRGLMRFLHDAYLYVGKPGDVPSQEQFKRVFDRIKLADDYFNTDNFPPGGGGELKLYRTLQEHAQLKG